MWLLEAQGTWPGENDEDDEIGPQEQRQDAQGTCPEDDVDDDEIIDSEPTPEGVGISFVVLKKGMHDLLRYPGTRFLQFHAAFSS